MKTFVSVMLLAGSLAAQPRLSGKLVNLSGEDTAFVARHTKVVLITRHVRDTVSVNDDLTFEFPRAESGRAYLYLDSPVIPRNVDYKFRLKKNEPTTVALQYDKFRHPAQPVEKTPEERENELMTGLFIARLAVDIIFLLQHWH